MGFTKPPSGTAETIPHVLVVDDDVGTVRLLGRTLAGVARVRFATRGQEAIALAREDPPDLVLLDAEMPGLSGFDVCVTLKADPTLTDVPVIFVTSHRDEAFEVRGFEVGAADFIAKPVNPRLVLARVRMQLRHKHMADRLRMNAMVDGLTGLANRRRFDEALEIEWSRARRAREPLSLILLDVDHFKRFNDRYGHPAGDACLIAIGLAIRSACLRATDIVTRYGGEEFAVLLPNTTVQGANLVAQRVIEAVSQLAIPHEDSPAAPHVTVSGGVAWAEASDGTLKVCTGASDTNPRGEAIADLLSVADEALYRAKAAGRARIVWTDLPAASWDHDGARPPALRRSA